MELYYKDLISKDASLEKLVDNLMLVVQGATELAKANGSRVPDDEVATRLQRLKEGCQHIRRQAVASALATDKVMRQYPYSSAGFAFAVGLITGALLHRKR